MNRAADNLKTIAEGVAHALVDTSIKGGSAFISTPLLYPSGSHVVVRMDGSGRDGLSPTMAMAIWKRK
jgi:hypothetical protein